MTNKELMLSYLKKLVIEPLKDKGYTGKYPHFRKVTDNSIQLISFQTNKQGGSFTVEVSSIFPKRKNKNFSSKEMNDAEWDYKAESSLNVWCTNQRYRLEGMYDGWFYYGDLYVKRSIFWGKIYYDVSEKEVSSFVAPKGCRLVQKFNDEIAVKICEEINHQLVSAFEWLQKFEKKNK